MVGIVQEQHPERARLFMQWKRMPWPILSDPLDRLDVFVVPQTFAIDERGIIRATDLDAEVLRGLDEAALDRLFLDRGGANDEPPRGRSSSRPDLASLRAASAAGRPGAQGELADALVLWGGEESLGEAIAAYRDALARDPNDARAWFRLGVAYRMRYDAGTRRPGDFQAASEAWTKALDLDPDNYIWRRRIQQYGPRLEKPYAFYDWVETARREVAARGDRPIALVVDPRGTELAGRPEGLPAAPDPEKPPDPAARVRRDEGLIVAEVAAVPAQIAPGAAMRVHVALRPDVRRLAHWNNEAEDLVFWTEAPLGWGVTPRLASVSRPREPVSGETRVVEVEVRAPHDAHPGQHRLPAYALYYVCEDVKGACLYRRQDVTLEVAVRGPLGPPSRN